MKMIALNVNCWTLKCPKRFRSVLGLPQMWGRKHKLRTRGPFRANQCRFMPLPCLRLLAGLGFKQFFCILQKFIGLCGWHHLPGSFQVQAMRVAGYGGRKFGTCPGSWTTLPMLGWVEVPFWKRASAQRSSGQRSAPWKRREGSLVGCIQQWLQAEGLFHASPLPSRHCYKARWQTWFAAVTCEMAFATGPKSFWTMGWLPLPLHLGVSVCDTEKSIPYFRVLRQEFGDRRGLCWWPAERVWGDVSGRWREQRHAAIVAVSVALLWLEHARSTQAHVFQSGVWLPLPKVRLAIAIGCRRAMPMAT